MRRKLLIAGVVVVSLLFIGGLLAQPIMMAMTKRHSPFVSLDFRHGDTAITLEYCRPYKKGREIFGGLVPYGEVWRTGANEATVFETDKEILFGGERLAAGRYALFTIPGEEEWTIILNEEADQWGAFDYNSSKDVLRVTVEPQPANNVVEQLSITINPRDDLHHLDLVWDSTLVTVPIELDPDSTTTN